MTEIDNRSIKYMELSRSVVSISFFWLSVVNQISPPKQVNMPRMIGLG